MELLAKYQELKAIERQAMDVWLRASRLFRDAEAALLREIRQNPAILKGNYSVENVRLYRDAMGCALHDAYTFVKGSA